MITILFTAVLTLTFIQTPVTPAADPRAQEARTQTAADAADALATQVMLDRAGYSPGAIDGKMGPNTRRALDAFRRHRGQDAGPDAPALVSYTITPEDAEGPFAPAIPDDMIEKSKLDALAYTSAVEALAERFHTTPALLRQLNPDTSFTAGSTINVPNVEPLQVPEPMPKPTSATADQAGERAAAAGTAGTTGRADVVVTVRKSSSDLTVTDAAGQVVMYAPVTTGSEHDPLPIGEWKVNGVQYRPKFHYNPKLFWDADPSDSKAVVPAGPNNPVGLVWIDISKPHYGLHGTPEPAAIGRTESHGCVRLTNWDAIRLAALVKPGTRVVFEP